MRKIKNICIGLAAVLMLTSVSGCGGRDNGPSVPDNAKNNISAAQEDTDGTDSETNASREPSPEEVLDIVNRIIDTLNPDARYHTEAYYLTPILDALDKGDADTIYAMYAPNVQNADPDLMRDIKRVTGMYKGVCKSYVFKDGSDSDSGGKDGYRKRFTASYRVETTEETYMLLIGVNQKGVDEASTGVTSIALIRAEDYDAENEVEEYYCVRNGAIPCDRQYLDDLRAKG